VNRFAILLLFVVAPLGALTAQVTETAIAFDSAGKVRTLTPSLVARFSLTAPVWPVTGEFLEARLYEVSSGGHVLAVERVDRRIERYQLTADNVSALRFAIDSAMTRTGQTVTEERTDVVSQPASGAFVRNQMLLTWLVYGPSLAALTDDPQAGTAMYLLATGASYFITTAISRKSVVTRAQNHMATDGALRGWGIGAGLTFVLGGDDVDGRNVAAAGLAGSLGGAIAGFQRGRNLTDSEAEASTSISNLAALTTFGVAGTAGLVDNSDEGTGRGVVAATIASGLVGYAVGPEYPRRARYRVTRGDIQVTGVGGILGAAIALTPVVDTDVSAEVGFGLATAGLLAGTVAAERAWARAFDHTNWDATQTQLGLAAGGLMGAAAAVLGEPDPQVTYALVVGGATLGAILGRNLAAPARAGSAAPPRVGSRLTINPAALGFAATGVRGQHALVSLSF
jgi:hypothetical protein